MKQPFTPNEQVRLFVLEKSWNSYNYERIATYLYWIWATNNLLQPKQDVFLHLTYSRSEKNNAWIIPLEVMKFVYLHPTYVLSVLIIGLNINWTTFWFLFICTRPTSYLNTITNENMTRAKWWNTSIAYQHFGKFIRPVRHEEKPGQEMLWIWHAAAWASS